MAWLFGDGRHRLFENKLYDLNAEWRNDPISDSQKQALERIGVHVTSSMTKGDAADLISAHREPEDDEIEFLAFFGVKLNSDATQLDARNSIARICSKSDHRAKWELRPASRQQRFLIQRVEGAVSKSLTWNEAEELVRSYAHDPTHSESLEEAETALAAEEDREAEIESIAEYLNSDPSQYDLSKVGIKLITQAIEKMEQQSGRSLEKLHDRNDFFERLASTIKLIDPSKTVSGSEASPMPRRKPEVGRKAAPPATGRLLIVLIALVVLGILYWW